MCTKEDMTELQRACHLLKKGWELQKHSVRIYHLAARVTNQASYA